MESKQIRETYMSFFEERGHLRVPSASLVPAADDPSVLLTTAGMQPFQPYFLGRETPPAPRLTSCQRCFQISIASVSGPRPSSSSPPNTVTQIVSGSKPKPSSDSSHAKSIASCLK